MKKALPIILFVLIALLPTYFIIFNSLNASGLPDFARQVSVDITFPATANDPTHGFRTYTKEDPEFLLLTEVLSYRTPEDALPEGVDSAAYYSFTFQNESGVSNTCRLYTDPASFRTYLTSSQGKVFRLATPALYGDDRVLVPTFVRYALNSPDFASEDYFYGVVELLSDYSSIDFVKTPVNMAIKAYTAEGESLGSFTRFSDVPAYADHITVTASFPLSENLNYHVGYTVKRAAAD